MIMPDPGKHGCTRLLSPTRSQTHIRETSRKRNRRHTSDSIVVIAQTHEVNPQAADHIFGTHRCALLTSHSLRLHSALLTTVGTDLRRPYNLYIDRELRLGRHASVGSPACRGRSDAGIPVPSAGESSPVHNDLR
jgi:hypothetical protein